MRRTQSVWKRAAAGAVTISTVLLGLPTAAHADDVLPNLAIGLDGSAGEISDGGKTPGIYPQNVGGVPATGVTLTLDLSGLADTVTATVPAEAPPCTLAGTILTCEIGTLETGDLKLVHPIRLTAARGTEPGPAGSITATIAGDQEDADPSDDSITIPITVTEPGPDLAVTADDLNTPATRIGGGDRRPLKVSIRNEGSVAAGGFSFTISTPEGTALIGRYSDCTYTDYWPGDEGGPWAYGPNEATCTVPQGLAPGAELPLTDANGRSLFTVRAGRNLSGPAEHYGFVSAALTEPSLAGARRAPGSGPSLASLLGAPRLAQGDTNEFNNYDDFVLYSKRNPIDVAVSVPVVRGNVGETVDLSFQVVNHGPSDGGGPGALIVAPTGTVILPSEWCWTDGTENEQQPESTRVRCNFESFFPTVHSGYGRVSHTVPLKIKATPGRDGTVEVRGEAVAGTESRPANNTARIVVRAR